jgi:hypothetical protein
LRPAVLCVGSSRVVTPSRRACRSVHEHRACMEQHQPPPAFREAQVRVGAGALPLGVVRMVTLLSLPVFVARSSLVFAHVRAASEGTSVSESNCHPFTMGPYLFMHNGCVSSSPASLARGCQPPLVGRCQPPLVGRCQPPLVGRCRRRCRGFARVAPHDLAAACLRVCVCVCVGTSRTSTSCDCGC